MFSKVHGVFCKYMDVESDSEKDYEDGSRLKTIVFAVPQKYIKSC